MLVTSSENLPRICGIVNKEATRLQFRHCLQLVRVGEVREYEGNESK
jgi:hypothetical protein